MTEPQIFGTHEPKTLDQLRDVASRAERAALMADGHLGYVMPIGGVAAYRNQVSVVGVGFDIACGNAAIRTDLTRAQLVPHLSALADTIQDAVSFGMGRKNRAEDAPSDDPLFEDPAWDAVPGKHERERLRAKARDQLGTVGSGNHYVDVFADEADRVWVGVHFGSRGFGFGVAHGFLALGQNRAWGERVPERETLLDIAKPVGEAYWQLMNLAGRYAYAGRDGQTHAAWAGDQAWGRLAGDDARVGRAQERDPARRGHRRKPARVPPAARRARGAGPHRRGAARPAPAHRGDGGGGGVRSLQGLTLHLVPQPVQLVERRAANLDAALLGEQLHRLEPPRELVIRPLECGARVDGELAREIHHREQQIADLIF